MISVFSSLLEMLLILRRNYLFLIVISLVIGTPRIICERMIPIGHAHSAAHSLIGLIGLIGMFLFDAVYIAAIIGLLSKPSSGKAPWPIIWNSIKTYTWTLCRLDFLLVLIAFLAAIPFALLLVILKPSSVVWSLLLGVIFVLIKYALAYPFVVVENMGARQALKRSWKMTRRHFGYVFGCYFFLWLVGWSIGQISGSNAPDIAEQTAGIFFLKKFVAYLIDSLWVIMSWCMYLQVKAADAQMPPAVEVSTN